MTKITISIPPESAANLQRQAEAFGEDVATYVAQLLQHFAQPPAPIDALDEDLASLWGNTSRTEDETAEDLHRARHVQQIHRQAEHCQA